MKRVGFSIFILLAGFGFFWNRQEHHTHGSAPVSSIATEAAPSVPMP